MQVLTQAQLFVGQQTGRLGSTSTATFERGPREGVHKNSSDPCGYLRTLCKSRRLRDAVYILNHQSIQPDSSTYVCLLQECIKVKDLAEGKQVHTHIIQSAFKPNMFLLNTLVNMYAKCGSVVDARQVFDKMPERDMFTWSIMIAGYTKHGYGREAFKIYDQLQVERVTPNKVMFICILNACASLGALEKGKKIHADIIKAGVTPDIILETALAGMYAKCGSMKDARHVFDTMAQRDLVSWNAMIAGYAQHGYGREALEIYEQMQRERVMPNRVTFICILNACASITTLEKGKEVHAVIVKAGISADVVLETALADMYAKCGSMKDAHQIFKNMVKKTVVSWNSIITGYAQHGCGREAFEMYEQMQRERVTPNRVTFISVLNACAGLRSLEKGKEVHGDIIEAGIALEVILETALADMYAKCGSMKDARQVFDNMAKQDVVSWSAMIRGYAQDGCYREAFEIYEQMQRQALTPDRVTFGSILNVCASLGDLERSKRIHADISKSGVALDTILENTLVDIYAKCGSMKDACQVFNSMANRNVVSWSAMIAGYVKNGCGIEAFEIYEQMQREEVTPDRITFISILNTCASLRALEKGKLVHADIMNSEIASYVNLENSLIDMYAKCGAIKEARQVFNNMVERDVVSWSAMIAGYGQHGCGREALQLFEQLQQAGFKPNCVTFVSLLSTCSHVGLVDEGHHYFYSMIQDHGLTPAVEHFSCMVDLLGRAGQLDQAEDFINSMPIKPDVQVWIALLGACRVHGNVEAAEHVAKSVLETDPENPAAYVPLSNINAAVGDGMMKQK